MTATASGQSLLQSLARFVGRLSSVPVLLMLVVLSFLFPVMLFPLHGVGDILPLDLHFSYNPAQVHDHLAALGTTGRGAYTRMLLISDMAFPAVYATALSVALMLVLCRRLPVTSGYLCLFPYLIVIADWGENLALAAAVHAFPGRVDATARIASSFTSLKWVLIMSTLLMLLAGVVFRVARCIRRR